MIDPERPAVPSSAIPSLAEIAQALVLEPATMEPFSALQQSIARDANARRMLTRLRDLLQSGEGAILSRAARKAALVIAADSGMALMQHRVTESREQIKEARTLLQLENTR